MSDAASVPDASPRTFPQTDWTTLRRLRPGSQPTAALDDFCRAYWYPLFAFLRHKGYAHEEAQDHIQSFFVTLLNGDRLALADPARGRLRNYLMTLVARHAASRRAHAAARKRGGGVCHVPFDWTGAEAAFSELRTLTTSPEEACRIALAAELVERSVSALRAEYAAAGKAALFEAILPTLEGPLGDTTYAALAPQLGLNPGTVRMAASRLRGRFARRLRADAAKLLGIPEGPQLDLEIRELLCGPVRPAGL